MGVDPVTLGIGALGTYLSNQQSEMAGRRADHAQNQQDALVQRQSGLFDKLMGIVQGADSAGQFDPTSRINAMNTDLAAYEHRDQSNLAGAMRTSGYRPGDSELATRSNGVAANYALQEREQDQAIRQNAFGQKLQAYGAVGSAGAGLDPGIGAYGQRAGMYQQIAGQQSPAGLIGSMAPYFYRPPAGQSGWKLGPYQQNGGSVYGLGGRF